mmetsp:Transcript_1004/g.2778  ORF Transcript_1004/g.2778 Transcript_1004/m.2778 type:complete len:299 (-) Transcript_1004:257-1153(-)
MARRRRGACSLAPLPTPRLRRCGVLASFTRRCACCTRQVSTPKRWIAAGKHMSSHVANLGPSIRRLLAPPTTWLSPRSSAATAMTPSPCTRRRSILTRRLSAISTSRPRRQRTTSQCSCAGRASTPKRKNSTASPWRREKLLAERTIPTRSSRWLRWGRICSFRASWRRPNRCYAAPSRRARRSLASRILAYSLPPAIWQRASTRSAGLTRRNRSSATTRRHSSTRSRWDERATSGLGRHAVSVRAELVLKQPRRGSSTAQLVGTQMASMEQAYHTLTLGRWAHRTSRNGHGHPIGRS